jgi:hypothetical protein
MDKPANDAVSTIFESKSVEYLRGILTKMAKNDDFVSSELPYSMHNEQGF